MIALALLLQEIGKKLMSRFSENDMNVPIKNDDDFSQSPILQEIFPSSECLAGDEVENAVKFCPPVYVQRYVAVKETLLKFSNDRSILRKVVDFGCAEMSFFYFYLKKLTGVQEVLCVDIDEELLERYRCKTLPLNVDYIDRRQEPLKVLVLSGSVDKSDVRLKDTDAVVAIELIEHLYPETLEELPYRIFGIIQPKMAIFTTPNADFNVVFPNFTGFRHDDHKFEWSRDQFRDWALNISQRFPEYEVSFSGIGAGPKGTEQYGCCSQMATFIRNVSCDGDDLYSFTEEYKLISSTDYPVNDTPPVSREILTQVKVDDFLRFACDCDEYMTEEHIEIPMERIFLYVSDVCVSMEELREVLNSKRRKILKTAKGDEAVILPLYGLSDEGSNHSSFFEETDSFWGETETTNAAHQETNGVEEEDWDTPQNFPNQPLESGICSPFLDQACGIIVEENNIAFKEATASDGSNEKNKEEAKLLGRCHSLEEIKSDLSKKVFRRSLCCDAKSWDINLERKFQYHDSESADELGGSGCWSVSRAGDSGYPNSSEQMDLTPEQVEEINGDSSQEEEEDNGEAREAAEVVRWGQEMENGDVANNNRDWEGNNMEGEPPVMIGQPLVFEDIIDHRDYPRPNHEGAPPQADNAQEQEIASFELKQTSLTAGNSSEVRLPVSQTNTTPRTNYDFVPSGSFCLFSSPTLGARAPDTFDPGSTLASFHILNPTRSLIPHQFGHSSSSLNVECSSSEASSSDFREDFPAWLLHLVVDSGEPLYEQCDSSSISLIEEGPEHIVEGDLFGGGEPLSK